MKLLEEIREDIEIEMAEEFTRCRGDVYAEKEALWLALRDERVSKMMTSTEAIQGVLAEIRERYWSGTGTQWEDRDRLILSAILRRYL